jgi:cyclin B
MIACKQEEIYSPSIRDFVCITDNAYTKKEIFEMEFQILKTMEFNTVSPSSLRFFELIAMDFNFNSKEYNFGLYLLELYLIDYRMTKFIPSVIACSAAYIVMKFFKLENYPKIYTDWNINSGSSSVVKDCAREMCFLVDNITGSTLQATKKKFSHEKYDMVSEINFF